MEMNVSWELDKHEASYVQLYFGVHLVIKDCWEAVRVYQYRQSRMYMYMYNVGLHRGKNVYGQCVVSSPPKKGGAVTLLGFMMSLKKYSVMNIFWST